MGWIHARYLTTWRRVWVLIFCAVSGFLLAQCESPPKKPNILLIVADDLGYNDLGLTNPLLHTPNINALASEGVRFARHYTDASCSPTRAGLLTGQHPARLGFRPLQQGVSRDSVTLPKVLRLAGYNTFHVGKWHVGNAIAQLSPIEAGFDHWFGYLTQWELGRGPRWPTYRDPWLQTEDTEPAETPGHLTDIMTEKATEVLERLSNDDKPWFLNLWYFAPHGPLDPAERFAEKYPDTPEGQYRATIDQLDDSVGRVLAKLSELGLAEDTLVVFMSDNGGTNSQLDNNAPFKGIKGQFREGGVRTPMIWRWPGELDAGTLVDETVSFLDVTPTLAGAIGQQFDPSQIAGQNLWPSLTEGQAFPMRALFWEYMSMNAVEYSVLDREGRFRLRVERGRKTLYDVTDAQERNRDVIDEHPDIAARLEQEYESWHAEQHGVRVKFKAVGKTGAGFVSGDGVQRSPGYSGFTFAIGVIPDEGVKNKAKVRVIADQSHFWTLGFRPGRGIALRMLGESLKGPVLAEGRCSAVVVASHYTYSARYPRNNKAVIDLYINGARVDRVNRKLPKLPPTDHTQPTRIGFEGYSKKPARMKLSPPQFFNDYFKPARDSLTTSNTIEELTRSVCSPENFQHAGAARG